MRWDFGPAIYGSRCRSAVEINWVISESALSRLSLLNRGQHPITEVQAFAFAHTAVDGKSDLPHLNSESA